jgi:anti-sigma B factor antagonist
MALELEYVVAENGCLVRASGEVDLYSSPKIRDMILKAIAKTEGRSGVDLSGVTYMDSSGVATLVEALKESAAKKKHFLLITPSNAVMKVLQLSRLDAVFNIQEAF